MRERSDDTQSAFATDEHDHQRCIDEALDKAAALCLERGARLTELRRRVLELVWRSHEPVGAYAILEQLQRRRRSTGRSISCSASASSIGSHR